MADYVLLLELKSAQLTSLTSDGHLFIQLRYRAEHGFEFIATDLEKVWEAEGEAFMDRLLSCTIWNRSNQIILCLDIHI